VKRRRFTLFGCVVSAIIVSSPVAAAQAAGPVTVSAVCPTGIGATMTKVNDYWIAHNPNPTATDWTTGAYFAGELAAAEALTNTRYRTYALNWATAVKFALKGGSTDTNANDQAVGQTYIGLYQTDPQRPASDIAQIDRSVQTMVSSSTVDDWWWIDALFMAMPDFAQLGTIENNPAYFTKMYAEFQNTAQTRGLWNANKGLWWRDQTFAGSNTYWSRGNGWVIAALARVLDVLPTTDPHRTVYVQTLQQMAAALKSAQQPDGFWYVSLGDPTQYPGPETSGTAFFTYGLTWGIEHGILDPTVYQPIVTKAWNAMASTSVQPSGSLGYVQGPGTGPASSQPVTAKSTASYGVGAFLLAGSELTKLCGA
jgi:unsaturated rhamnogalacturonyl hydrolase